MKNIPNILTISRILLIPFFVMAMFQNHFIIASGVLALSGLTDCLDGFLARKYHWISYLGQVLDPVADKLTHGTVCVVLSILYTEYLAFFLVMIFKELTMMVMGGYILTKNRKVHSAKWFGKLATTVFYFSIIVMILFENSNPILSYTLLGITTACVLFAFVMYVPVFLNIYSDIKIRNK